MKACLLVSACVCVRDQSSSHKLSIMVKTLNELSQLKDTGFGQPRPRHGLNLLYWFAQDYITFSNGDIVSNFQPQKGDFGFHKYQNRVEDDDDDHIVPVQNLPYYEDTSGYFNRVYVTEHNDPKRFDKDRTYRVSQGLLWNIKNTSREQFLKLTSNTQQDIRIIVMSTVRTLSYLSDLRETGFGHPPPRHGLNLLWWFAHECVQIDFNGRLTAECNPTNGAFGFHRFHNRDGLLPYSDLLYYEVGNLNSTDSLPDYVTKNHTRYSNNSNKDRIIVSFDPRRRRFENIYVTQHSDQVNFDQNHTYRISAELIKDIQDLSYEEFLREPTNRSAHASIAIHKSAQANTCPSNSNELIQDMIWEEILREPTNHSEDVSIGIHQSEQTNSCQSTSNELQDIQDLSWEEYNRELLDDSIDVPQRRMPQLRTLNELAHLRETKFGQPYPRHGLILLWWFANKCVEIDDDGKMIALCDLEEREFGFHPFHNSEEILPDTDLEYYEMGNLHYSDEMPEYVTKNYNSDVRESNADRIVVSVNSDCNDTWFDRIYVTHHLGQGCFDVNSTYRISQGLIKILQKMERSEYIREVKIKRRRKRGGRR
ncbi:hypothetical protein Q8A67_005132 [Cirrhinus molitorella]|uniref:Uncharacterized protein n=2 Tax=Cirrhinus molitorella TaxID=172907 RepID=A0AA88Q6I7_9TELE|nr:hypothetical protein Q8A67_005132 [Cirrhinus molitorella]